MLPNFKYHPNCLKNDIFVCADDELVTCMCCGKHPDYYYETMMYSIEDVDCLCPECIADGAAAKKFDGSFIQDAEPVEDAQKQEELFCRTPGLVTWQGEHWLACCKDYCAFIAYVGTKELEEMGITGEVYDDYAKQGAYDIALVKKHLMQNGSLSGYLFQCLHCGKHRIWVDAD